MSVPKNLAFLIPEILARLAVAGRARTLPVPPVGRPVGRREEDVRNAKATRSRDSVASCPQLNHHYANPEGRLNCFQPQLSHAHNIMSPNFESYSVFSTGRLRIPHALGLTRRVLPRTMRHH